MAPTERDIAQYYQAVLDSRPQDELLERLRRLCGLRCSGNVLVVDEDVIGIIFLDQGRVADALVIDGPWIGEGIEALSYLANLDHPQTTYQAAGHVGRRTIDAEFAEIKELVERLQPLFTAPRTPESPSPHEAPPEEEPSAPTEEPTPTPGAEAATEPRDNAVPETAESPGVSKEHASVAAEGGPVPAEGRPVPAGPPAPERAPATEGTPQMETAPPPEAAAVGEGEVATGKPQAEDAAPPPKQAAPQPKQTPAPTPEASPSPAPAPAPAPEAATAPAASEPAPEPTPAPPPATIEVNTLLRDLRGVQGYRAAAITDAAGEPLWTDVTGEVDLPLLAGIWNDVFRTLDEVTRATGMDECVTVVVHAGKGILVIHCGGTRANGPHLHAVAVLAPDGNQALMRLHLERALPRVRDALS